jgi:hypothetical protein
MVVSGTKRYVYEDKQFQFCHVCVKCIVIMHIAIIDKYIGAIKNVHRLKKPNMHSLYRLLGLFS